MYIFTQRVQSKHTVDVIAPKYMCIHFEWAELCEYNCAKNNV